MLKSVEMPCRGLVNDSARQHYHTLLFTTGRYLGLSLTYEGHCHYSAAWVHFSLCNAAELVLPSRYAFYNARLEKYCSLT